MLDITQLNASLSTPVMAATSKFGTHLEAPSPAESSIAPAVRNPKPVVTWRVTRSCNLNCLRCASDSRPQPGASELTTEDGIALINDLAAFQVPRLLFAGGEPLMRADLQELVGYAHQMAIEPAIFTNATLLNRVMAARLKSAGLRSISILLEGVGREVDHNRGVPGAFNAVLEGYESCVQAGLDVEIRTPLDRSSRRELSRILDFVEGLQIHKVVFSHVVQMGSGNNSQYDLSHEETRHALDLLLERAEDFERRGVKIGIATDENHADGVYQYLRLARRNPERAEVACRMSRESGAHLQGAGVRLAGIDSIGDVHPDAYWASYTLGNVRETPFSEIWGKSSDPLLRGLRNRLPLLKGKCANCRWKQACGGNLRVRAQEYFGDPWTTDPACYLTDDEIDKEIHSLVEAMEDDVLLSEQAA